MLLIKFDLVTDHEDDEGASFVSNTTTSSVASSQRALPRASEPAFGSPANHDANDSLSMSWDAKTRDIAARFNPSPQSRPAPTIHVQEPVTQMRQSTPRTQPIEPVTTKPSPLASPLRPPVHPPTKAVSAPIPPPQIRVEAPSQTDLIPSAPHLHHQPSLADAIHNRPPPPPPAHAPSQQQLHSEPPKSSGTSPAVSRDGSADSMHVTPAGQSLNRGPLGHLASTRVIRAATNRAVWGWLYCCIE